MQLHEQFRPTTWAEVVGQDKIVARIQAMAKRGLTGRAFWLSGSSGTGKTTIARLIAAEVADEFGIEEIDAGDLTIDRLREIERTQWTRPLGKGGRAVIVNEAHGLRAPIVRKLLTLFEPIPPHMVWAFTTTVEGQDKLFEDLDDANPLLSRCTRLDLARRDLAQSFAARAQAVATAAGLNGRPIEAYIRLAQKHRNNLRASSKRLTPGKCWQGVANDFPHQRCRNGPFPPGHVSTAAG